MFDEGGARCGHLLPFWITKLGTAMANNNIDIFIPNHNHLTSICLHRKHKLMENISIQSFHIIMMNDLSLCCIIVIKL